MRFFITSTTDPSKPAKPDEPPSEELIAAYISFNEEMHKAGVLVASEGLSPQGGRARVVAKDGKRVVTDGPFAEAKELLGGFYLIEVASREEAIAWALRCPVGMASADVLELYQMTSLDELPTEVIEIIKRAAPTWTATLLKER